MYYRPLLLGMLSVSLVAQIWSVQKEGDWHLIAPPVNITSISHEHIPHLEVSPYDWFIEPVPVVS